MQLIKTWQLLLLLIVSVLLSATFLRLNNIGMIERRTAVLAADKAGDVELTRDRLYDLQRYTSVHMNADSNAIYLEEEYKRALKKIADAVDKSTNDQTIADRRYAFSECAKTFTAFSSSWALCIGDKLSERASSANRSKIDTGLPSVALYKHEFTSPIWSADFAGFSVLLSGLITVVIILRLLGLFVLKLLLRRHYKSI